MPEGVQWTDDCGYLPVDSDDDHLIDACLAMDARLDTFTRCLETTDVYVSLINEFIDCINNDWNEYSAADLANRAIHALGEKE